MVVSHVLSTVEVIKRLCNPESSAGSHQAVRSALSLLHGMIRESVNPDTYSLASDDLGVWLDYLESLDDDTRPTPLLAYWMNRYAHHQQEFSQVVHRYRDPTLKRLGCVVIGQLVHNCTACLRTRLLEIIEDPTLTQVVFASVVSCREAEVELTAEFSGLVPFKSISLVNFETKNQLTRLRADLHKVLGLPDGPQGVIVMPERLKKRIFAQAC